MCRSIIQLRGDDTVTETEVRAAALQFVRKVSGYRAPSQANTEAFETAVREIMTARVVYGRPSQYFLPLIPQNFS